MSTRLSRGRDSRAARTPGFDRRLIAPLVLGALLNPINSSMIAVALIPIGLALGASPAQTAWLVSALYLSTAIGQPVVGRLVDEFGVRPVYLASTVLVGAAGLVGAFAPGLGVLVAARVLLGLGTCAGYPSAMYLIRSEARRTGIDSPSGILATLAVAAQTVVVVGPTLGGLLIGLTGWRSIFAVNIPLAIACVLLGLRRLPRSDPDASRFSGGVRSLDLPGMTLFAVMLTALMLFLMRPGVDHLPLVAITVLSGAGFVMRETRVSKPFLDVGPLATNVALQATYLRQVLASTVSYTFLYGFTQWLEAVRGLSASQTGLILLPMFLTAIAVTSITGRRAKVRGKLIVGGILQLAACVALLTLTSATSLVLLVGLVLLAGAPQGLNSLANQNAVYHQADPERMGSSAGLLRTFGYLGAMIAAAANAAAFGSSATTGGLHDLAEFLVVASVLFLAVTLVDRRLRLIGGPHTATPA